MSQLSEIVEGGVWNLRKWPAGLRYLWNQVRVKNTANLWLIYPPVLQLETHVNRFNSTELRNHTFILIKVSFNMKFLWMPIFLLLLINPSLQTNLKIVKTRSGSDRPEPCATICAGETGPNPTFRKYHDGNVEFLVIDRIDMSKCGFVEPKNCERVLGEQSYPYCWMDTCSKKLEQIRIYIVYHL